MELDVDRLASEGVTLAFERPFGRHVVVIGPSGGVSGQVATDDAGVFVDARTPDVLRVLDLTWQLESGAVAVDAQLGLHDMEVALNIPKGEPAHGRIVVRRAESEHVHLEHALLEGEALVGERVELRGVEIQIGTESVRIGLAEARFDRLAVPIGGQLLQLHDLHIEALEVEVPRGGGWDARVKNVTSASVQAPLEDVVVEIASLVLKEAGTFETSGIRARHVGADSVDVRASGLNERSGSKPEPESEPAPSESAKPPLDLSFLDRLNGHIHLDVTTDIRIPILKQRRATHELRVDVEDGMIRYKRLERGLANLEDAVLDFEVHKGRFILEKDLPLVPFDNKTLVSWHLEPDELALAKGGWIRLARLVSSPRLEVGPEDEDRRKDAGRKEADRQGSREQKPSMVREILARNVDIALGLEAHPGVKLPNGMRLRLGGDTDSAVERLQIRGDVTYRPSGDSEPTEVGLEADGVVIGLEDLPLGNRLATVGLLRLGRLKQARIGLAGVKPSHLQARLEKLRVSDFEITPPTK